MTVAENLWPKIQATGQYGLFVPELLVDDRKVYFDAHGRGPALLIPWCNFAWDSLDLDLLTSSYTVVIASPRGFGNSDRMPGGYAAPNIRRDLEAVLDSVGVGEYITFGYSLSGSIAAWLAHENPRVRAVVSGGFPITTSYHSVLPRMEANLAAAQGDAAEWEAMNRQLDPDAVLTWYRYLDTLPAGALADRVSCPIYGFWGGCDELIDELVGLETLTVQTSARGVPFEVIPDLDHGELLTEINVAIPGALTWLERTL